MAGGKRVKNKQKVKAAKKAAPAAGKSKKAVKAPRKIPNAGQRKKMVQTGKNASKGGIGKRMVKTPGKNTTAACKAPKTPKPKTATSTVKKIMGLKLTAGTNVGVGPSFKPVKKKTSKVQASVAIPGTSQNTRQTSTKKRAPKRKLDQPKQATPSIKKIRINIPKQATPSNKKIQISLPKQEMPRFENKRPILFNMVQPIQSNPFHVHNKLPVQEHYHYHQKKEDFQIQEETRPKVMPVPDCKANNHFVDKYREALIRRVPLVDPILDSLMAENVLDDEQYDNIRSKPTTQEKMRELYKYIMGIGDAAKDKLYDALKKHNALLIQDLKGT